MARQTIDTTLGGGDSGYAGGQKANANFAELYARMLDAEARLTALETETPTPTPTPTPTATGDNPPANAAAPATPVSGFAVLVDPLDSRLTALGV